MQLIAVTRGVLEHPEPPLKIAAGLQHRQHAIHTIIESENAHAQNGAWGKVPRPLPGQPGLFLRPWATYTVCKFAFERTYRYIAKSMEKGLKKLDLFRSYVT